MSGVKHDNEKVDLSLLSTQALLQIGAVMTFGKRKYSANNWRGGISFSRLEAAAMRHILAWNSGETLDPESGLSHLAHASCCLMMLLEFEATRPDLDDRYRSNQISNKGNSEAAKVADKIVNALEQGMTVQIIDNDQCKPVQASSVAQEIFNDHRNLLLRLGAHEKIDNEFGPGTVTYKPYVPKGQP